MVVDNYLDVFEATNLLDGTYSVEFNSSDYSEGIYDITLDCLAPNYERKTGLFNLEIMG